MTADLAVAHVHRSFFGRTETFIGYYLANLRRVRPICISLHSPIVGADVFQINPLDCYGAGRAGPRRYSPRWFCRGVRRRLMRLMRGRQYPAQLSPRLLRWAQAILARRNVRLLHAHFGPVAWEVLPLRRAVGIPLVTSFYGYDVASDLASEGPEWPSRRQQLFEEGDLFLVEGPFMRQRMVELGCPAEKVQIQRIAVKTDEIPFAPRKPRQGGAVLAFVGRFTEKKGLMYALQAVREVRRSGREIEFRIIGDGGLTDQVLTYIRENSLEGCVRLLGFLDHPECLRQLQDADIFVHPSVIAANGDCEGGAPTIIIEAQALGMPVVSTWHCDIPNVTLPGESAILVPERDSARLADALVYLLDHPEKWEEMGRAGRSHVEKHHNIDREVTALEEKYFRLACGATQPMAFPCAASASGESA